MTDAFDTVREELLQVALGVFTQKEDALFALALIKERLEEDSEEWERDALVLRAYGIAQEHGLVFLLDDLGLSEAERAELEEAERRAEWREGIVNVLDHEGNYLGCMGSETWAWTLDGGIERLKEQNEALLKRAEKAEAERDKLEATKNPKEEER